MIRVDALCDLALAGTGEWRAALDVLDAWAGDLDAATAAGIVSRWQTALAGPDALPPHAVRLALLAGLIKGRAARADTPGTDA